MIFLVIDLESVKLSTNHGTNHHLGCRAFNYYIFRKVLDVSSESMVKTKKLLMFVERRILATLCQPNEHQRSLAYWAWEPPMNTPATENPICRQVMQGVLVPNMHFEVCLYSSVVCPYPFLPRWTKSSIRGSMYTLILFPGCSGIINDKNMLCR